MRKLFAVNNITDSSSALHESFTHGEHGFEGPLGQAEGHEAQAGYNGSHVASGDDCSAIWFWHPRVLVALLAVGFWFKPLQKS